MLRKTITAALRPLLKNYTYTVRRGLAKSLKRRGGLGLISQIIPLTKEEKFLTNLDLSGQTVYDVGGYEGVFTIFFARAVGNQGRVITFEPNPENYNKILEKVELNKFNNVEVRQVGLGKKREKTTLVFCPSEPGYGSVQKEIKAKILEEKGAKTIEVEIDSLDNQIAINNLPKPDFIKIDVEGLEAEVLLGMRKTIKDYKPKLLIEIHGVSIKRRIENAQRLAQMLIAGRYSIYHIESTQMITTSNTQIVKEGHLYCT